MKDNQGMFTASEYLDNKLPGEKSNMLASLKYANKVDLISVLLTMNTQDKKG